MPGICEIFTRLEKDIFFAIGRITVADDGVSEKCKILCLASVSKTSADSPKTADYANVLLSQRKPPIDSTYWPASSLIARALVVRLGSAAAEEGRHLTGDPGLESDNGQPCLAKRFS